jgi:hypothetical protein
MSVKRIVARWTSQRGRYWLELTHDEFGYSYKSDNGGGVLPNNHSCSDYEATTYLLSNHIVADNFPGKFKRET